MRRMVSHESVKRSGVKRREPHGWEPTVTVIMLQALVELLGMLVYLRRLPRFLA
jgi:hypothetical protein